MTESVAQPPGSSQDTASLLRRLAGPSVTKAGLAKDQTEINKLIAEASKGSKFYENEKRKDKELTERIAKILKIKDELVKEANIQRVEMDADKLLDELDAERDLSQAIVHVDMDAFFASVELLHNPDLEGKPFGVGSLKGVLSTASYEARKHGVRSGMAGFVAKKLCPELIVIPVDFVKYNEMSRKVMSIFKEYDPTMIVAGCDEGYLNITKYCDAHGISAEECVQDMRRRVHEETKLTVSAGIAPNKMLAKICSDKNKPNGQYALPFERDAIVQFMRDLSIRKLPGVGRVHERLLDSIGVKTCGDIYAHRAVIWLMDHYFGKTFLYSAYLGIASNVVEPYQREERKSIGAEQTFNSIKDCEKILEKLEEVAIELESEMRENGWAGKTVTLKYKLDTFQACTRAKSFNRWITKKDDLLNTGKELLKPELPLCIRLIGLRITKLKDLRAPADQGIKRFFQITATNHDRSEPSPKKRKMEIDPDAHDSEQFEEFQQLIDEEEAGAIRLSELAEAEHEGDLDNTIQIPEGSRETVRDMASSSKPRSTGKRVGITSGAKSENRGTRDDSKNERHQDQDQDQNAEEDNDGVPDQSRSLTPITQPCPICGKQLDARDNLALNAHIDFCLSKDVIKEASASADASALGRRAVQTWNWKEAQKQRPKSGDKKRRSKR